MAQNLWPQIYDLNLMNQTRDCLVAFGSNSGETQAVFQTTVSHLQQQPEIEVTAISRLITTKAVGGPLDQPDYGNAVFRLNTSLNAATLHQRLKEMETAAGRERRVRWSPRCLDLDLLLYGDSVIDTPDLLVPHPRMTFRRFVLEPAAEIAGSMPHPIAGKTMQGLLDHLNSFPDQITWVSQWSENLEEIFQRIQAHSKVPLIRTGEHASSPTSRELAESATTANAPVWKLAVVQNRDDFETNLPSTKLLVWGPLIPGELEETPFLGPQLNLSSAGKEAEDPPRTQPGQIEIEVLAAIQGMSRFGTSLS